VFQPIGHASHSLNEGRWCHRLGADCASDSKGGLVWVARPMVLAKVGTGTV
jgi:hypothetical protein